MDRSTNFDYVRPFKASPGGLYYAEARHRDLVAPSMPPGLINGPTGDENPGVDRSRSVLQREPLAMHQDAEPSAAAWCVSDYEGEPPSEVSRTSGIKDYATKTMDSVATVIAMAALICLTVLIVAATSKGWQFYDTAAPGSEAEVGLLFQDAARMHPRTLAKQPQRDSDRWLKASTGTTRGTPGTVEASTDLEVVGTDNSRLDDGKLSQDMDNDREWTIDTYIDTTQETSTLSPYNGDELTSTEPPAGRVYRRRVYKRRLPARKTPRRARGWRRPGRRRRLQTTHARMPTVSTKSDSSGDDFLVLVPEEARR